MSDQPIRSETLRGGDKHSFVLKRHTALRLTDVEGRASVAMLFYRADLPIERYNMPDTLKAQHTAFLTTGRVLLSDMGHVLCSITADTCGWHDTITGHQTAAESVAKYGPGTYQDKRNAWHQNSRDNLLIELGKWGLGKRDLHANLNAFVKVAADAEGRIAWAPQGKPGAMLELRAEMDVLVVLSNTPHHLDPSPIYAPAPVQCDIVRVPPPGADDPCRIMRDENRRAFALTEMLY
jgi:urea carboxylase-associated protein 2